MPVLPDRSATSSGSAGVFARTTVDGQLVGVMRGLVDCRWWHESGKSMALRRSAREPVGNFGNTSMGAVRVL